MLHPAAACHDDCCALLGLLGLALRRSSPTLAPNVSCSERERYNDLRAVLSQQLARALCAAPAPHTLERTQALARTVLSAHTLRAYSRLLADIEAALQDGHTPETDIPVQELLGEVAKLLSSFGAALKQDDEQQCATSAAAAAPATLEGSSDTLPKMMLTECNCSWYVG